PRAYHLQQLSQHLCSLTRARTPRSPAMPEPERFPPTLAPTGAPDPAAGCNPAAAQREAARPDGGFPQTVPGCANPPADPDPGTTPAVGGLPVAQVGRYPVLRELGRGGMGAVLLSRDPELGRD